MGMDVVYNKLQIMERCIKRIHEEYEGNPENLMNYTKQDSIILNIQRTCEAAIDLAMHLVSEYRLGIPQNSREAFLLLHKAGAFEEALMKRMQGMVGFRNIAVHDYQSVNLEIVQAVIEMHLKDVQKYARKVVEFSQSDSLK